MHKRLRREFVLIEHVQTVEECAYEGVTDQQRLLATVIVDAHLAELEKL
jgi:hypothetical protein